jgi:hypothetical protein
VVYAHGQPIQVPGSTVPSFVDWDNDGLRDLITAQGSGSGDGMIRVYLNVGSEDVPEFGDFSFVQSEGRDLKLPAEGCIGLFPRVVYWDADDRKDLVVGEANGYIWLYLNVGTDETPTFDGGARLQMGPQGAKRDIKIIRERPTPVVADWNADGRRDLVVGASDGRIRVFINEGTDTEPDFIDDIYAQMADGSNLDVGVRSSPIVHDVDGDGLADLISGTTGGEIFFYYNVGTSAEPLFDGPLAVESAGAPIDLPGELKSRPELCYWTSDGYFDLLVGAVDGTIRLYQGVPRPADLNLDGEVDGGDFTLLAACFSGRTSESCDLADLNGDGVVDHLDLEEFCYLWLGEEGSAAGQ